MRTSEMYNKELDRLSNWVDCLRTEADNDLDLVYSIFYPMLDDNETKEQLCIVGGWSKGFSADYSDVLYISKANPNYAMCVKVAVIPTSASNVDFDSFNMPVNKNGNIEDNCVALEREDTSFGVAMFYLNEYERILKEFK